MRDLYIIIFKKKINKKKRIIKNQKIMKSMARRTISTKQTDEEESNVAALGISR